MVLLGKKATRIDMGVMAAVPALSLAASVLVFVKLNPSAAFVYALAIFIGAALLLYSYSFFLRSPRQTRFGMSSPKMLVCIMGLSFVGSVLLETLTLWGAPLSTPLELSDWSKRRIAVFFAVLFSALVVYVSSETGAAGNVESSDSFRRRIASYFSSSIAGVALATLAIAVVCLAPSYLVMQIAGVVAGRLAYLLLCLLFVGIGAFFFYWKKEKMELLFVSTCLLLGSFLVFTAPPITAISWDDQIHYDRALGLSYLGHSEYSEADQMLATVPWAANDIDYAVLRDSVDAVADSDATAERSNVYMEQLGFASPVSKTSLATVSTFGYIPSAIGLWVARLFHAPILISVILGKLGNLVSYAIVVAYAIRIIPTKKTIMMLIGLLPTSIFLASNYSYDSVVTSFLILAAALMMREMSFPDEPLSARGLVLIIAVLFFGLAPKAVYFPTIGLLLLMPRSKFRSRSAHKWYIGIVVAFGVVMVLSFVLPMLFSAEVQAGDARGGSDVNASRQIAYILSNPFDYASTLVNFTLGYVSPINSDAYSIYYAYMGSLAPSVLPWASTVPFALLLVGSLIDCADSKAPGLSLFGRLWDFVIVVSSITLVCTALYVSFTAVGASTIAGCQARYLIPLLFYAALLSPSFCASGMRLRSTGTVVTSSSVVRAASLTLAAAMIFFNAACSYFFIVPW